ncbi:MAG: TolC family protein [Kofleriaceae bacterium]
MIRSLLPIVLAFACVPTRSELHRPVDAELARRLGTDVRLDDAELAAWLAKPIDKATAVRIALANNARVRGALAELGIAAGGFRSPFGATTIQLEYRAGDGGELEGAIMQEILGVFTAARTRAAARADVAAGQAAAIALALRVAVRVETAFHDLIASQRMLELRRDAFDAADAAALVRERMHAAGTASDLAQARDRDAREQARIELARAEATALLRRESINALLGLSGDQTKWTVTGTLPELPAAAPAIDTLEATAVAASLALAGGRARADAAANHAADQRLRSVLPHLSAGVAVSNHDDVTRVGPAIELGLPLFDWNSAGRTRANAEQRRASHELTAIAVELRAGARSARITALATYGEAKHLREVVLPLRQQILDETIKHYNAMDADPFALILARRELAEAHQQFTDALRRFANAMAVVRGLERGVLLDRSDDEEGQR